MLNRAAVVEDLVNALAAHRQLAQRIASRQRGYLCLVDTTARRSRNQLSEAFLSP